MNDEIEWGRTTNTTPLDHVSTRCAASVTRNCQDGHMIVKRGVSTKRGLILKGEKILEGTCESDSEDGAGNAFETAVENHPMNLRFRLKINDK